MLSIDKVIEVHENIEKTADAPISTISAILWAMIGIVFLADMLKNRKSISLQGFLYRGAFFAASVLTVSFLIIHIMGMDFSTNEKEWEKEYLMPYISSLPENKIDIIDFKQLGEAQGKRNKNAASVYPNSRTKPIWLNLTIAGPEHSTKSLYVQARIQQEDIEQSYLTYKTVNKTITDKYSNQVYYDTTLHIPKEYKVLIPSK